MKYVLTEQGKLKCNAYIAELNAKRKEILDARMDTANETDLPTIEDIESDIAQFIDEDGDYYNGWGVTDNYDSDYPLGLKLEEDFIKEETEMKSVCEGCKYYEVCGDDERTVPCNGKEEREADGKLFPIQVQEILVRTVWVKAKSAEEAERIAESKHDSCDIVLDSDDLSEQNVFVIEDYKDGLDENEAKETGFYGDTYYEEDK